MNQRIVNRSKTLLASNNLVRYSREAIVRTQAMRTSTTVALAASLMTRSTCAWTTIPASTRVSNHKVIETHRAHQSAFSTRWMTTSEEEDVEDDTPKLKFRMGDTIQVEVVSFGPMGATVDIVGVGHDSDDLIGDNDPPLGVGLILQREIHYFREGRKGVDVVAGEILPAYIEKQRDDGKIDVSLRPAGGKAKAVEVSKQIMDQFSWSSSIPLGDKSSPEDIARQFPGVSKAAFKKAVAALYKKGLVKPGPHSITKMAVTERR